MLNKPYKIFTKRLASELCKQGFQIIGTEINNEKPWLYVYLFENTPEFLFALEELLRGGRD